MQSDLAYYRWRKAAEVAAAAASQDSHVTAIHQELARRYEERIMSLGGEPTIELHLVNAA